jgi:MFS family permease
LRGTAIPITAIHATQRRAVSVFAVGWLAIALAVLLFGWTPTWRTLTVPTDQPLFSDMRSVQGAIEAVHHGLNPQVVNPADPWHRTMDYPIVWERIAERLHFEVEADYLSFEIALVVAFLASVAGMVWWSPSWWLVAAAFSSSILLLVERGNNDLAVFSLVCLAQAVPLAAGLGILFVAALLKLYPVLCWPAFIRTRNTLILAVVLGAALFLLLQDELGAIHKAQPMRAYLSYGSPSFAYAFKVMGHVTVPGVLISAVLVIAALGALLLFAHHIRFVQDARFEARRRFFYAGAFVFLGTFVLGSNWDYRLTFLLFCVPLLATLKSAVFRRTLLIVLLVSLNHSALGTWFGLAGYAVNELAKGMLFVLLAAVTTMVLVQDDVVLRLWQRLTLLPKLR